METTDLTLTVEQVPRYYLRCFQQDCPKAAECMHYLASQHIADDVDMGDAVYPTARLNGDCRWFKQVRVVRMAWGFGKLFNDVKRQDYQKMRKELTAYLGSFRTYYRYHHGERKLTPERQAWIRQLFLNYGYTAEPLYDHTAIEYDFTE